MRVRLMVAMVSPTRDTDIRHELLRMVQEENTECPDTLIVEEMALYGGCIRADLAVLNGVSHGYEIKSDLDTLDRLPRQVGGYGAVFERATLVVGKSHLRDARRLVPPWWGVVQASRGPDGLLLRRTRQARPNPTADPYAIATLLWRSEAIDILRSLGLDTGVRSKPMPDLMARLAQALTPHHLWQLVREALRARGDWTTAARRKRDGATSQPLATPYLPRRTLYGRISR